MGKMAEEFQEQPEPQVEGATELTIETSEVLESTPVKGNSGKESEYYVPLKMRAPIAREALEVSGHCGSVYLAYFGPTDVSLCAY